MLKYLLSREQSVAASSLQLRVTGILLFLFQLALAAQLALAQAPPTPIDTRSNDKGADISDSFKDDGTEIHIKDADISSIIKIFSKKTKKNYILDERVRGKVSIYLPSKVSDREAARVLDAILSLKGFTIVPVGGNVHKVVPSKEARKTTIPTVLESTDDEPTATVITRLVRLNYVSAEDLQNLLNQLVSPDGMISAYARSNSLVIIDYADNIKRITDIIDSIDIPSSDTDMTIVPIVHADSKEVAETLKQILNDDSKENNNSATQAVDIIRNRLRQAAATKTDGGNAQMDIEGAGGLTVAAKAAKIIPDARTNSIILVANETETMRLRAIISQLDAPVNLASNRFYVYRCQHASAEDLASVLGGLSGGNGSSATSTASSSSSASSGGFSNSSFGSLQNSTQSRLSSQRRNPGESGLSRSQGATSVNFGDNVAITADPSTNSLIIAASRTDYEKVLELLKELDIKRRQVLVEATILEVGIDDQTSLGVSFTSSTGGSDGAVLASNGLSDLTGLFNNPTALNDFTIAAASAGSLTLPGGTVIPTQAVLVNAAQASKNVNVLSAPNILTTDNEEAQIVVGNNVPFISSTSTAQDNLNNTFNQVDRQDVGITLRITPQISSGDFVTLRIFTEVSDVVPSTANSALGPTTTLRTSETTVIVKSDQMIATGGLISDNSSESDNGIPVLKDIPVLGSLFKDSGRNKRQTNLLIFIRPRVIKDQFDAREVSASYRDTFKQKLDSDEISPGRDEVLKSPSIDNVAESSVMTGPKPSTITPPKRDFTPPTMNLESDEPISLKSSPPAPKFEEEQDATIIEPSVSVETEDLPPPSISPGSRFIILEGLSDEPSVRLPFQYQKGGYVGVLAGPESADITRPFFKTGSKTGYRIGNEVVEMKVVGAFDSYQEALSLLGGNSPDWRSLTPHEIINLGKQPWVIR
jgi:general secretion pathway protein D